MSRRRGFTFVEMIFVTVLSTIILGVVVTTYGYAASRTARTMNETAALMQAQMMMERMEKIIQNSVTCSVVTTNGNPGLRCTIPNSGTDKDGDLVFDTVNPTGVSRRGIATFVPGRRVWFYRSTSGALSSPGTRVYMASRNDDSSPGITDVRPTFGTGAGGYYKWSLIDTVSYSVDAKRETVTVTIRASTRAGTERLIGSTVSEASDNYVVTLTRTIAWRNFWR